jgi:hypothetical protein
VNEDAILRNGCDGVCVDEVVDQATGRRVVDVCRVDAGGVTVLGEQRFLELFVVGTCVVVRIGISHNESRRARCRALHAS